MTTSTETSTKQQTYSPTNYFLLQNPRRKKEIFESKMKVTANILAIFLAESFFLGTSGFAPKAPAFKSKTALASSIPSRSDRATGRDTKPFYSNDAPGGRSSLDSPQTSSRPTGGNDFKNAFKSSSELIVQGSTLKTWSFPDPMVERVQVLMKTEGRPLNADVELWQGPDNTPQKMRVYLEDGSKRPFCVVLEAPRGSNAIAVRNTNSLEFPLAAFVEADSGNSGLGPTIRRKASGIKPRTVQGGAVHTYPFAPAVDSVQVVLATDGRPLNARVELLQGPNNIKQVMELYTEDGLERPFTCIIETPGTGNVIRVVNTATIEYPMTASVEPYSVRAGGDQSMSFQGTGGNIDTFMNRPF
jgi:hypothetical protein